jgi:acyl-coenzyme A synthetase/AMP-(fatty) acid ligase
LIRELRDWVAEKLGGYQQPRWIEFLPELPKTTTGKLQRFKLRQHQEQQAGTPGPET